MGRFNYKILGIVILKLQNCIFSGRQKYRIEVYQLTKSKTRISNSERKLGILLGVLLQEISLYDIQVGLA